MCNGQNILCGWHIESPAVVFDQYPETGKWQSAILNCVDNCKIRQLAGCLEVEECWPTLKVLVWNGGFLEQLRQELASVLVSFATFRPQKDAI